MFSGSEGVFIKKSGSVLLVPPESKAIKDADDSQKTCFGFFNMIRLLRQTRWKKF